MNKQTQQKYLNKLNFIGKINNYHIGWIYKFALTCPLCKFDTIAGCTIKNKRVTALIYLSSKNEIKTISLSTTKLGNSCVEFLRSPKK